jgi:DNA-binding transcriptional ArsR family regulator
MIEKIITSKTRSKLLRLFLTHIDNRYYLRELERMLDESLSPLRRQLIKLTNMGILLVEEEANLKYYKLNKNFAGIEELKKLVSNNDVIASPEGAKQSLEILPLRYTQGQNDVSEPLAVTRNDKRFKYDITLLTIIAFLVLAVAVFVVYTSSKNITQVASLVSGEKRPLTPSLSPEGRGGRGKGDEMASKSWKVFPGNVPVLSTGEMGGKNKNSEL